MCVGAVEAGDVGPGCGAGGIINHALDLTEDEARLGVLVGQLTDHDRRAFADVGPQLLVELATVVADHTVRRGQDRLRGAVVALQLDDLDGGPIDREVVLEVQDVADVGAAEAVDRLCVVADHAQVSVLACDQLEQAVLSVIGVLVLVDEDMSERGPVAGKNLGEQLKHVHGPHQQIVEVHRVHPHQLGLVERVGLGDRALKPVALCVGEVTR